MDTRKIVLVVDDEPEMGESLRDIFRAEGLRSESLADPSRALELARDAEVGLLVSDVRMPVVGGLDLLKAAKASRPDLPVVMITGYASVDSAVLAMRYGAANYFTKPLPIAELVREAKRLLASLPAAGPDPSGSKAGAPAPGKERRAVDLLRATRNPAMAEAVALVEKAAASDAPVLVLGESGTGKELVADALHCLGGRRRGALVKVNCAALPETLLEDQLFGHERGAFTGADDRRPGTFEAAHGGTLFLDEIGDMSAATQAKILRAVQERTFQRVGGTEDVSVDVRFVSATNRDPEALMAEGLFREDLYYRLSVVVVELPPLRDRPEDIVPLAESLLGEFAAVHGKRARGFSGEVRSILESHRWPGNVRELRNCVLRAVIFCDSETVEVADLASQYREKSLRNMADDYVDAVRKADRDAIAAALARSGGSRSRAAELLSIHRKTLYNKMKKLGIE